MGTENEKNDQNMILKNEIFLAFLKISCFGVRICNFESRFSCFFMCNFIFFSFSFVFDGFPLFFSLIFMVFLDFRWHGHGKWKKWSKHDFKKWNFPRVFVKISWVGVRICNFESRFSCFFHLQLHVFYFPLILMVFHCFSLICMVFLDFRCHGHGNLKKHDKAIIKKWKFPRVFEDFLFWSENLQLWVQIFMFFFIFNFLFFHFPLFLMVFHWFALLSWISGATGKEND